MIPNKNKQTKYASYYDALLPYDEAANYDNDLDNETSYSMIKNNNKESSFQGMES